MPNTIGSYKLIFLKKEKLSRDTYSFYFTKIKGFEFLPGQYLKMMIEGRFADDRGNSRYFTVASSPTEENYIFITTRIIKSAFKKNLFSLEKGFKVNVDGPFGNFIFDEKVKKPLVFLAGGIGITPFRSIIRYIFDKKINIPINLFSSFSKKEDIIFGEDFTNAQKNLPAFKYIVTITKTEESKDMWNGETGRIDRILIEKYVKNIHGRLYYIVGPTIMVSAIADILRNMGILSDNIKTEDFPGY